MLAPSNRAVDLREGRRALQRELLPDVVALGPALPISRRSRMGVPVGVRANLTLALSVGGFDVVHGFEPGLPSLSYLALREASALSVATFFSPDRLAYPLGKAQRDRLLARVDALLATTPEVAEAAKLRFPGDFRVLSRGVDTSLFRPGRKTRRIVVEWDPTERPAIRAADPRARRAARLGADPPAHASALRPPDDPAPPARPRAHPDGTRSRRPRGRALPGPRLRPFARGQPRPGARGGRVRRDERRRPRGAASARDRRPAAARARRRRELRRGRGRARPALPAAGRAGAAPTATEPALAERDWILCDLHMHTSWSHDCSVEVDELLDYAEAQGLGAIAVTDHNAFGGALEAVEKARGRNLVVIPGEEIKTDGQGEVIGLFLTEEIPRGMSFADTLAAIRAQNGLVYLPHPFDRRHAIPDPATLHRHLAEIDVFEVYNARLLFETYNDEALRFARKYNLTMGAGSDAHVLPGVGTGAMSMRAFRNAEEFMISLHSAQVLRRPKSLAYLQSLKWMAQVKEKVL